MVETAWHEEEGGATHGAEYGELHWTYFAAAWRQRFIKVRYTGGTETNTDASAQKSLFFAGLGLWQSRTIEAYKNRANTVHVEWRRQHLVRGGTKLRDNFLAAKMTRKVHVAATKLQQLLSQNTNRPVFGQATAQSRCHTLSSSKMNWKKINSWKSTGHVFTTCPSAS